MATTAAWYGLGLLACLRNDVDLEADRIMASLHTTSYTPDLDTHDFFNDATNELPTANGYTAGGVTLSGKVLSYDAASDEARWDFDDPSWTFTGSTTFRYMVLRKARGGASTADELIAVVSWDSSQTVTGAWSPAVAATGLLYIRRL